MLWTCLFLTTATVFPCCHTTPGYAASDIVGTLFRMTRSYDLKKMPEPVKLSFLKVIGFTHMRIADEVTTQLQLTGLIAKLCGAMLAANQQQR